MNYNEEQKMLHDPSASCLRIKHEKEDFALRDEIAGASANKRSILLKAYR
jgi:hypothetical protein